MRKSARKILFYFFAAAFLVSAPLVVLSTAGFRISLNNQRIQQTGALAVSTTPRGATVNVDGKVVSGKTPTVVQRISPNDVTVKLEKKGYLPLEETVHVNAGETTYLTALLYADVSPEVLLNLPSLLSFAKSTDGRYIGSLSEDSGKREISLYDVAARYDRTFAVGAAGDKSAYTLSWLPKENTLILSRSGIPVNAYSASGEELKGTFFTNAVASMGGNITFKNNGSNIEAHAGTNGSDKLIALLPLGTYTTLETDDDYVLIKDSRETLYLLSLTSSLVASMSGKGALYDWLPSEHTLIWSDGLEVNMYNADKKEKTFVTRQSLPITSLVWHPSGQAIITASAKQITAIDIQNTGTARETTLTALDQGSITNVWLDDSGKELYYLNMNGADGELERRRLVK
jgi:WD40 repeat protein